MSSRTILICEGDSLTATVVNNPGVDVRVAYPWAAAGLTAAQIPGSAGFFPYAPFWFPFQLGDVLCINRAIGGSRIQTNGASGTGYGDSVSNNPGDLTFRAPTWIDALVNTGYPGIAPLSKWENSRPTIKYILSVMIGTNPDTSDPTTHCTNLKNYLQARLTAFGGFLKGIIVLTLPSRGDNILGTPAAFETYRQGINTILRGATWQNSIGAPAIVCADIGADPVIGAAGACNDAALFSDTIHPTALGYSYIVPPWLAKVNELKTMI